MTDPSLYRSVVGALQYATITRPDISYAVNRVCQFLSMPTIHHWKSVKRILRYLKGTMNYGLHFCSAKNPLLVAFSDADWAGDPDTRRSTEGYCVYFGGNLLSWSSRKQRVVARSSTEAEYRALASATTEVVWIQQLLRELRIPLCKSPRLYTDNVSAQFMTKNPVFHKRSKHIQIDYHFVREKVERGNLLVNYVPTADQYADVLTKALSSKRFAVLRSKLAVSELPQSSLREDVKDSS